MTGQRIGVTGVIGNIGSAVVRALAAEDTGLRGGSGDTTAPLAPDRQRPREVGKRP